MKLGLCNATSGGAAGEGYAASSRFLHNPSWVEGLDPKPNPGWVRVIELRPGPNPDPVLGPQKTQLGPSLTQVLHKNQNKLIINYVLVLSNNTYVSLYMGFI